ncbi:MAG TPA: DUF3667 domain-containing protein [Xanthomonadales bacterium]|nr:DUF3667 domain-containing protein [Xanthomonadales bacterium]
MEENARSVGTDAPVPRLTLRAIGEQVADELLSFDRGLPWTFAQLSWRPGNAVRAYLERRDPRLTKPLRYFVIVLAAAGLALAHSDFAQGFAHGFMEGWGDAPGRSGLVAVLARPEVVFTATFLPALAAAISSRFARHDVNTAEALATATYLTAQALAWFTLLALSLSMIHANLSLAAWPIAFVALPIFGLRQLGAPRGAGLFDAALSVAMAWVLALLLSVPALLLANAWQATGA